jgi:hypothetical protein
MRALPVLSLFALLIGCATYVGHQLDQRFGRADPGRFDRPLPAPAEGSDWRAVKTILDQRCVVCHGCYDAPCQLNMSAYEGITRGAHKDQVYAARLVANEPTRLFVDARSNVEWRGKGFYPVLNERRPEANREGSVMYRLLALKRAHPLPDTPTLSEKDFDFALDRAQQCPSVEEMDRFEQRYPRWGMPYGLPGLSEHEHNTLTRWLDAGAPAEAPAPLTAAEQAQVAEWERFLNGDDNKTRLMSRYLYEHLFLGNLYFEDATPPRYFRLVRSKTAPGEPLAPIASRRPYDDPKVARVYYRLEPVHATLLAKTHQPYALSAARRARWEEWFLHPGYTVAQLPGYDAEVAANPFIAFRDLPLQGRYRFLLDDAQFFIMGFIKGPVCRGQVALNVINDYFWVMFTAPDKLLAAETAEFLAQESRNLRLPAEAGSSSLALIPWLKYSRLQREYLEARSRFLNGQAGAALPLTLDLVWNGDGRNPNAALTVFRHFDSASVVRGFVGAPPKTAWLIGYPLFERIHYLLVAGFDLHGNVGHQLNTRLYMDFLRMEGEFNFLTLLPKAVRERERDFWYREVSDDVKEFIQGQYLNVQAETAIRYRTREPKQELYALLQKHLHPVLAHDHDLAREPDRFARQQLTRLAAVHGRAASWMPETAFVSVVDRADADASRDGGGRAASGTEADSAGATYTVLRNSAHLNISHLFDQQKQRVPDEDTLTVVRGFLGAYPNAFYKVTRAELPAFVDAVARLQGEADYAALMTRFGIRRTDPRFWAHSDRLLRAYAAAEPITAGLFDYNRLENR